ncbi:hypothetical protein D3C75_1055210 [compost metagenome]
MKILITADKNDFQQRLFLQGSACQLHAGHDGHLDIRHHNIHHVAVQHLQRFEAAGGGGAYLHIQTAPIHKAG